MKKRVAVVGGGISGLAAAWAAWRALEARGRRADVEILLLERGERVGGKARTLHRDGWLVEAGPTGYLDDEPVMDELVAAAGLTKLPASAAAAVRFVVRGGRMRRVDPSPLGFARSGILSVSGLLRIAQEPFRKRGPGADESVWDFARRRLGRQAADRLIAPMVLGVFAGDARRISLPAAFPRLAELEREHGSLVRGMLRRKKRGRSDGGPAGPAGRLTSFRDGLQELPLALARRAPFEIRTSARVASLAPDASGHGWRLRLAGESDALAADAVVLACDGPAIATLLRDVAPGVASAIDGIPHPTVLVTALGYPLASAPDVPRGFGCLIPRGEGYRILGTLWDSHVFAGRSRPEMLLVRALLGGSVDPSVDELDDDEAGDVAQREVARLLSLPGAPVYRETIRWPQAIPQYEVGHVERRRTVERELARARPGLFLAGNSVYGVSFGRSARTGWEAGRSALRALALGAR